MKKPLKLKLSTTQIIMLSKEYNEDIKLLENPLCYSIGNYFSVGGYLIHSYEVK